MNSEGKIVVGYQRFLFYCCSNILFCSISSAISFLMSSIICCCSSVILCSNKGPPAETQSQQLDSNYCEEILNLKSKILPTQSKTYYLMPLKPVNLFLLPLILFFQLNNIERQFFYFFKKPGLHSSYIYSVCFYFIFSWYAGEMFMRRNIFL